MFKKFVSRAFLLPILLIGSFGSFLLVSSPAQAGQDATYYLSGNCDPLQQDSGNTHCASYLDIQYGALPANIYSYTSKKNNIYSFVNNAGATIKVNSADPGHGIINGKTINIGNTSTFDSVFNNSSVVQPTDNPNINVTVNVDFGQSDGSVTVPPLEIDLIDPSTDQAVDTKPNVPPQTAKLSSNPAVFKTLFAPEGPGQYKVCAVADYLTPTRTCSSASTKTRSAALNITLNAKGDLSKINGSGGGQKQCDGGAFSWIACPIIDLTLKGIQKTQDILVNDFLKITPLGTGDPAYAAWKAFLGVADILLAIVFIIAVFGAAVGLDNYTIKKVLPRLIAAAILMQGSYFIATIAVDIGNILGAGISQLIPTPTNGAQFDLTSTGGFLTSGAFALGVIAGGSALIGLSFATVAAMGLAFLVVIATLLIRKALIILLVVLSPIAFMAWVLPNTENLFKRWYKELTRLILMYPLIMLLFGAGKLFAGSIQDTTSNGLTPLLQLAALALPLFLVPSTLKASGALMGFAAGKLSRGGAMGAKKIGDSKFAEKRAENRQRRALAAATDPEARFLRKRIASSRAGFGFNPSATSKLKMAKAQEGMEAELRAGAARQLRDKDAYADEAELVSHANGSDASLRKAAIDKLIKSGNYTALDKIGNSAERAEAIRDNAKDILTKAPQYLMSGAKLDSHFESISSDEISSLSAAGHKAYQEYLTTRASATGRSNADIQFKSMGPAAVGRLKGTERQAYDAMGYQFAGSSAKRTADQVNSAHGEALTIEASRQAISPYIQAAFTTPADQKKALDAYVGNPLYKQQVDNHLVQNPGTTTLPPPP